MTTNTNTVVTLESSIAAMTGGMVAWCEAELETGKKENTLKGLISTVCKQLAVLKDSQKLEALGLLFNALEESDKELKSLTTKAGWTTGYKSYNSPIRATKRQLAANNLVWSIGVDLVEKVEPAEKPEKVGKTDTLPENDNVETTPIDPSFDGEEAASIEHVLPILVNTAFYVEGLKTLLEIAQKQQPDLTIDAFKKGIRAGLKVSLFAGGI